MNIDSNKKAFTLIELLVVISIIGLLSTLAAVALKNAREKAKTTRCRADLKQIVTAIELKRDEYNAVLLTVTGSGCSACSCSPYDQATLNSPACVNRMTTTFQNLGFPGLLKDPWGDPYLIDENEYEPGWPPCRLDFVWSLNCGGVNPTFFVCN